MNFDETKAEEMIGKYVLIGVNRLDSNEQILSAEQIYGKVLRVSAEDGLIILKPDGSEFGLPPLLNCYQKADKSVYSLKSSNEKLRTLITWQHSMSLQPEMTSNHLTSKGSIALRVGRAKAPLLWA